MKPKLSAALDKNSTREETCRHSRELIKAKKILSKTLSNCIQKGG